jgi:hypothetical protein
MERGCWSPARNRGVRSAFCARDLDGRERRAITPEGLAVNYFDSLMPAALVPRDQLWFHHPENTAPHPQGGRLTLPKAEPR